MPKRNRYRKNDVPDPIDATTEKDRINTVQTLKAIEGYAVVLPWGWYNFSRSHIPRGKNGGVFDVFEPPQITFHLRTP
jgi:hypothetical protein